MTFYENIFVEQYQDWQSVLKAFNRASVIYYSKMWPLNILREDVQFLPFDIVRMSYDDFCKFAIECLKEGPYKNYQDFFLQMVEKNYQKYLDNFIVK